MSLIPSADQHGVLTLLSSTSIPALSPLWTRYTDPSRDTSNIEVLPDTERSSDGIPKTQTRGMIMHNVVHLSSPDLAGTYIQAGIPMAVYTEMRDKGKTRGIDHRPLGIILPWTGFHIRPLGRRPFSIEMGVIDNRGVEGVIRISSFKHDPTLHQNRKVPLLHLPLSVPSKTASTLTPWLHLPIDLNKLVSLFSALASKQAAEPQSMRDNGSKKRRVDSGRIPTGRLGSVSYVRVYANCRLRRIWFAEDGERSLEALGSAGREEWGLYTMETID